MHRHSCHSVTVTVIHHFLHGKEVIDCRRTSPEFELYNPAYDKQPLLKNLLSICFCTSKLTSQTDDARGVID